MSEGTCQSERIQQRLLPRSLAGSWGTHSPPNALSKDTADFHLMYVIIIINHLAPPTGIWYWCAPISLYSILVNCSHTFWDRNWKSSISLSFCSLSIQSITQPYDLMPFNSILPFSPSLISPSAPSFSLSWVMDELPNWFLDSPCVTHLYMGNRAIFLT